MFLLYQNKSSLKKRNSRMLRGGVSDITGDKISWWEKSKIPKNQSDDISVTITSEFKNRPDLIASKYYGTTELEWLVLQYNNIIDVNEEIIIGQIIKIPSKVRAATLNAVRKSISVF